MSQSHRKISLIVLIIFVAIFFGSRTLLFFTDIQHYLNVFPYQDDARVYLSLASIILDQTTYEATDLSPFVRVPLYPLFIAAIKSLSPTYYIPIIFSIQQLVQLSIIVTVFRYIRKYYSQTVAAFLSLILTLFFDFTLYGFLVRPEIIFSAFILFGSLAFLRALHHQNKTWPILTSLLFGLATLTKPVAALLIIIPLTLITFSAYPSKHYLSISAVKSILIIGTFFLVLSPWLVRNYLISGTLVLQQDTSNIIHATAPGGHWGTLTTEDLITTEGKSVLEIDRELTTLALQRIKQNPSIWIRNSLKNFTFRLWSIGFTDTHLRYFGYSDISGGYHKSGSPSLLSRLLVSINIVNSDYDINPLHHLYLIANNVVGFSMVPITLLGLVLLPFFSPPAKKLFAMLLYFWLLTSLFSFSGSRYMVPLIPILFLVLPDYPQAMMKMLHLTRFRHISNITNHANKS